MRCELKQIETIDRVTGEAIINGVGIRLGVYSDEALRLIDYALYLRCPYELKFSTISHFIYREEDGEIAIMCKHDNMSSLDGFELHYHIFTKNGILYRLKELTKLITLGRVGTVGDMFKDCFANYENAMSSCRTCYHYLDCYLNLARDRLLESFLLMKERYDTNAKCGALLASLGISEDSTNIIDRLIDTVIKEKHDEVLTGAPLDPFRLESMKTLSREMNDILHNKGDDDERFKELNKTYNKLIGYFNASA